MDPLQQQRSLLEDIFSQTLSNLTSDAATVRQAGSILQCLGNVDCKSFDSFNDDLLQSLVTMDQLVSGLEDKVVALRQMVREESKALQTFESLQQEAHEQANTVQKLTRSLQEADILNTLHESQEFQETASESFDLHSTGRQRQTRRRDSVDPRTPLPTPTNDQENNDPISLRRIKQSELDAYKATNVMGPRMLSLITLNEALDEIETIAHRQWRVDLALKHKQEQHSQGCLSTRVLQRRYDYLQRRQQHGNDSHDTPGRTSTGSEDPQQFQTISEQDLRENCAFFRNGESTARATLSVLCSLRRIKQIPCKSGNVVYRLLGDLD
eukprot:Nitzschia sp. Nitz4//scaffold4_size323378//251027//252001//NITZ4_000699-RA/size323378-processed-gene-0.303-mRNA-1//1//CDS//3329553516//3824//frame0